MIEVMSTPPNATSCWCNSFSSSDWWKWSQEVDEPNALPPRRLTLLWIDSIALFRAGRTRSDVIAFALPSFMTLSVAALRPCEFPVTVIKTNENRRIRTLATLPLHTCVNQSEKNMACAGLWTIVMKIKFVSGVWKIVGSNMAPFERFPASESDAGSRPFARRAHKVQLERNHKSRLQSGRGHSRADDGEMLQPLA